jgi:31-O-methyltransferase
MSILPPAPATTAATNAATYDLPDGRSVLCTDPAETAVLWNEIIEEEMYAARGLTADDIILDVGAHIGLASVHFAGHVPGARILAFEPAPKTFSYLRENLARHAPRAEAFPLAVGATVGEREFTYFPRMPAMSTLYPDDEDDRRNVAAFLTNSGATATIAEMVLGRLATVERSPVTVTTLTNIITGLDVADIGLLKIDVERAELDVLNGLDVRLWPRVRSVVAEVHDINDALGKVVGKLSSLGFRVRVHQPTPRLGSSVHSLIADRH